MTNHTLAPQRLVYRELHFIATRVAMPPSAYELAVDHIYDDVAHEILEQFVAVSAPCPTRHPRFQFLESFAKAVFTR